LPEFSFSQLIYPPDLEMVMEKWHTLASGQSVTFEMRWKRALTEEAMLEGDTRDYLWTLSACMPVKAADGTVIGISGSNADISAQKESTQVAFQRAIALERARASEVRLNNYTQISPVAICRLDSDLNVRAYSRAGSTSKCLTNVAQMQYCNPKWFEITGHPIVPIDNVQWSPVIVDEDLEKVRKEIGKIKDIKDPRTFFFRTKKIWTSPDGVETPTWVLATGTVEEDDAGNVISILATMTDVSQLRWAEDIQKVRVEEALESKRQQENFIDMTSHEMRNPLSAMVQCADSVATSLAELREVTQDDVLTNHPTLMSKIKDLLDSSVDALVTIQACATHQKRIVDDILTLSKLDSKLLNISPITIQTSALLQDTYRMFKDEAHKAGVELAVHTEPSIQKLNIDWAILDPSRVLQVLINLITNAIKFTQDQSTRKVDISMGASLDVNRKPGVQYVQQEAIREDFPDQRKSDGGKVFYLHFTVRDTGCGLTAEHKAKLFMRFSQATPRTHIQV
jgi:signal transduction histidine kinase